MSYKMKAINDLAEIMLSATYLKSYTDDNIMSSVRIAGSHNPIQDWNNGIFENSRYFIFSIMPANGCRYYTPGDQITVELVSKHYAITESFRRSTTTPEKALQRIQDWIDKTASQA